jgi:RNA polymerase sigma factor (sigma-70 family)
MLYEVNALRAKIPHSHPVQLHNEGTSVYAKDKILWEAFKSGDELAFIHIYKSYCNILYNYGCQFTYDKELVRDCLQDFFIYLRKNKAGFGETNSIKTYLLKAFRRRVIEYFKKTSSEDRCNKEFSFVQFSVEMPFEFNYITQQTKAEELIRLNEALKTLDRKEREAIYYFYYEGMSYEQIAALLNFSHVSSARRVMYRGLRHLRRFFLNKDR